ncbi:MAG: hypothetical protein KBD63_04395 [Bacteriovoracaceae bacterium]|nr:hypothetical protein [Bacteriovoracaceae bacterium]
MGSWKEKFSDLLDVCHIEIKKTTIIGKHMVVASKTNTDLRNLQEELGKLAVKEMMAGRLDWEHPRAQSLLSAVKKCELELLVMEEKVQAVKKNLH